MELFDALQQSVEMEQIVMRGNRRLYDADKFRYQDFYGGIATCGAKACNLKCRACWNFTRNEHPEQGGTFYSPSEVAARLEKLAKGKTDTARISGAENFLGLKSARHLYEVIDGSDLFFVVETNAVVIGAMPQILDEFKKLNNFRLRVSIKATNGLMWEKFTGSNSWGFYYQQKAIKEIQARHIPLKVAFMPQFVDANKIDVSGYILEEENMRYYPGVKARLDEVGLKPRRMRR